MGGGVYFLPFFAAGFTRCPRSEAATDSVTFDGFELLTILAALDATLALILGPFARYPRSDAAMDFCAALLFGLRRIVLTFVADRLLVRLPADFFAMLPLYR